MQLSKYGCHADLPLILAAPHHGASTNWNSPYIIDSWVYLPIPKQKYKAPAYHLSTEAQGSLSHCRHSKPGMASDPRSVCAVRISRQGSFATAYLMRMTACLLAGAS